MIGIELFTFLHYKMVMSFQNTERSNRQVLTNIEIQKEDIQIQIQLQDYSVIEEPGKERQVVDKQVVAVGENS
ncbi:hypothetical protein QQF64_023825 [Cirrhinus molitorella]|uniref:Uncharacterized protein n=1 Tax=Cirrhinus molitorella TaxID=172907 RepID=A0ABR3NK40_9TELE